MCAIIMLQVPANRPPPFDFSSPSFYHSLEFRRWQRGADVNNQLLRSAGQGETDFQKYCRDVPDFPRKGVLFKDITPLIGNGPVFKQAIDEIASHFAREHIDVVACIESRGFIIGSALAYRLGCGVVPVRKKGKLPWHVYSQTYELEYGQDTLEIHRDAFAAGQRVLLVDDVLATGGTAAAVISLVRMMQGELVGAAFLMELKSLKGRSKIDNVNVFALIGC
jgi:adenine phosphoribosyltransferase